MPVQHMTTGICPSSIRLKERFSHSKSKTFQQNFEIHHHTIRSMKKVDFEYLKGILEQVQAGTAPIEAALKKLRKLPYEDMGFVKIDHHRTLRTGVPEVIYCEGKSVSQIVSIAERMGEQHVNILGTRVAQNVFDAISEKFDDCKYYNDARMVIFKPRPITRRGAIAVVCAGTSDIPVAEEACVTAEMLGNSVSRIFDVGVAGLHRLLDACDDIFNANVAVVVAGMEGALASVVGGLVSCPVIGVPTSVGYGASFGGISALLSMLNSCASGVSVVNIDNGFGAGYQASLINKIALGERHP
jgi:NCAIR mutase (PurE)-related protein